MKSILLIIFLAATGQLYKRVCRSVGRLVGRSVCRSDLAFLAFLASFGAVAAYEVLTSLVEIEFHFDDEEEPIKNQKDGEEEIGRVDKQSCCFWAPDQRVPGRPTPGLVFWCEDQ